MKGHGIRRGLFALDSLSIGETASGQSTHDGGDVSELHALGLAGRTGYGLRIA